MKLSNFETLDPNLLVGLVNTALRNEGEDLHSLSLTHDLDRDRLEQKLREVGFAYVEELNQFRAVSG